MAASSALYGYLAKNALESLPEMVVSYSQFNTQDVSTWKNPILNTALMYGPNAAGQHIGSLYDIIDSLTKIVNTLKSSQKKESVNNNEKNLRVKTNL